jgi:hypothetical protein
MRTCEVSAVLFATDKNRVARFYRDALGFDCTMEDEHHSVLNCRGFDLIVHQIPRQHLDDSETRETGEEKEVRERPLNPIRLNYPVDDIQVARSKAMKLGGRVHDEPPAWAAPDANVFLGSDPEGNVFKLSQRAR